MFENTALLRSPAQTVTIALDNIIPIISKVKSQPASWGTLEGEPKEMF